MTLAYSSMAVIISRWYNTQNVFLNTDASDWDSASTTSKASKNMPIYKLEEDFTCEPPVALPVVREQELDTCSPEAPETDRSGRKRQSPTATPPLPSPRSLTSRTGVQSQPQPQPRSRKNSSQKPESDEGKLW